MAFERYIRRHGKKLGPYYYENVRSHDGKVKTIYLGTNPHNHPKHRIKKPLFFLIIVLTLILLLGGSLFFLQNEAYLIQSAKQQPDFDVDQILLKVLIRSHESLEKQVRVMNIGDDPAGVDIVEFGMEDIAKIDSSSFVLKPGQTKVVGINFSSFAPEQKTEQQPGIYVGKLVVKSEKASKEIPMVVEIETKNVLFDMNLNPVAIERRVMQGSDVTIEVKIYNLQSIESSSVDVDYFVKDISGNTILTESETVVVTTQASFFKTISIPRNLKPGPYVFASRTRFGGSIGTASYFFEVIGPEAESSFVQFCKNSVLCLGLSLATMLLLFALTAYFYFFIGAYLYEKLTGKAAPPAKEKEKTEIVKPTIFERIKARISEWREESARIREEEENIRSEEDAKRQKDAKARRREEEEKTKREKSREDAELQIQRAEEEREQEEKRKKEKEELRNQKALDKQKAAEETKKKLKEFFHKIGLYKAPEEKKQVALQKESERREKLRAEEKSRKQEEAERIEEERQAIAEKKRKESERQKQEEAEAKKGEQERREKSREDAELQIQRAEEEKREREEKRKKEAERQRQEQIKAQKLGRIKEIEAGLDKNRETEKQLNSELAGLEAEKKALSEKIDAPDAGIKKIDDEISGRTGQFKELGIQKSSLAEKRKTQIDESEKRHESEKNAEGAKIKEMKAGLAARQNAMMQELEKELSRLPQNKRNNIEKWKRLEIKARLKVEEHNLEEEIRGYESKAAEEKSKIEEDYKKSLKEINKKQSGLNKEIADLQSQKQQILLEAGDAKKELLLKENEIQKTRQKLDGLAQERQRIEPELSRLKPELNSRGLIGSLMSKYREKVQKIQEKKAAIEAAERIREELKKKEPKEKIAAEERKPAAEDRLKLLKQEIEKEESREKPVREIKPSLFERLFSRKPEFKFKRAGEAHEEEKPAPEKKASLFGGLIGRLEKRKEIKEDKPAEQEQKLESEAEELEKAIRDLSLFKEIEKKAGAGKEEIPKKKPGIFSTLVKKVAEKAQAREKIKESKPVEKIVEKSKNLDKFYKALDGAKDAVGGNDISKAKRLYAEAREIYVGLDHQEKKEVYGRLMELYNKLSR